MNEPLGAWSNAPLAYVLAEVRTELLADIKNYQPKLGGRLRDEYPIQRQMQSAKLVATGNQFVFEPQQDGAWEFATADNRIAVILRSTGLVLHATSYVDSKDFLSRLDRVVNLLNEEVPHVYVNRLGLRYVDFVLPRDNELPEAYVDSRLCPDLGLSRQGEPNAMSLAIYEIEDRQLTLRYARGRGKPELPPDLARLSLDRSPLMKLSTSDENQITAVLDTDCILACAPVKRLDPVVLKGDFLRMHGDVSSAFRTAITAHATKIWGGQK